MVKIELLQAVYKQVDSWQSQFTSLACKKGCNACCSRNVFMTTLEAEFIFSSPNTFQNLPVPQGTLPALTTNQFANLCLQQKDERENVLLYDDGPCPFIGINGQCDIYPYRPLACRVMISRTECNGEAVAPPLHLTFATAMSQIVEHLDATNGIWGNMLDLLTKRNSMGRNCTKIPAFLIAPDEQAHILPYLQDLMDISIQGRRFESFLYRDDRP